jgi:hypothetical protein
MSVSLEQMTSTTEMWCGRSWEGLVDRRRAALAQAQLLRSATDKDSAQVVSAFLEFFDTAGNALFRDEEEWIFGSLQPTPGAVGRAVEEHIKISLLVGALIQETQAGCFDVRMINGLGELLEGHLLLEEEQVRPLLQDPRSLLVIGP